MHPAGIDTACQPKHYRCVSSVRPLPYDCTLSREDLVGAAVQLLQQDHGIPREQLWLQTKFTSVSGQDPASVPYDVDAELKTQVRSSTHALHCTHNIKCITHTAGHACSTIESAHTAVHAAHTAVQHRTHCSAYSTAYTAPRGAADWHCDRYNSPSIDLCRISEPTRSTR